MQDSSRIVCIVGAPRCGTTSLAGFLQTHPRVCFSYVKEPHFFSQHDLSGLSLPELRRTVEADYLDRFFQHRGPKRPLLGEGSVSYLYAPERMEAVLRLWPDARFVIALRDPMEMLPSLHRRMLYNGDETETDFERAWALTAERRAGRAIPRSCIDPRFLYYDEIARLGSYVDRLFRAVGRERCFVALFDDLAADPEAVYRRMMAFAGLAPEGQPDFAPRRATKGARIGWLQRLLKRPPVATRAVLAGQKFRQRIKPLNGKKPDSALLRAVFAGRERLLVWNSKPLPPAALPPRLCEDIRSRLSEDVTLLSELIGRNLDHWLGGQHQLGCAKEDIRAAEEYALGA